MSKKHAIERVLMTADTVGGVWAFALELARGLGAHGIEVILAALGGEPSQAQHAEAAAIRNLRLLTSAYKLEWMDDPWADVQESGRWLLDLERAFSPDLVHLNSYGHGTLRFQAPVVLTAHSCVVSWWAAVRNEPVPSRWDRYRQEVEESLKSVDCVVAPSRAMLRALEENYGPDLPPWRVVWNGRSALQFRPASKEAIVLGAGRLWDEAKNLAGLAGVAEALSWPVYVAGEGHAPNGKAAEMGACRPLGRLSAEVLAAWYGKAAIFAHPARYEPFGLCVLEAALSGCALVLGDIDSLREIWGESAVYVPPDDSRRLEAAISQLIEQPNLRARMACRSSARARALTPEKMAREYLETYSSLVRIRRTTCVS